MGSRYWIGTVPESLLSADWDHNQFFEQNSGAITEVRGQREVGSGGHPHWQLCIGLRKPQRLSWIRRIVPGHWEPTRSAKARDYVWKEDTRVEGSSFQHGSPPVRRNEAKDWAAIFLSAKLGKWDEIPPDVAIRCYNQLKRIGSDNMVCPAVERTCNVFWGPTLTGKSSTAWAEAGMDAYPKNPNTKWWDGYRGQQHVIIDEFRGLISISHLLQWLDRYPVAVECKGSSLGLHTRTFWICSNLHPSKWYPELDESTWFALKRRLKITHFIDPSLRNNED